MDPLKPFGTLIRSVWDKTVRRADSRTRTSAPTSTADHSRASAVAEAPPVQPLQARIHARMTRITHWDADQARDIFVESVLLSELGNEVANDPSFAGVVEKISKQLAVDPQLCARLDTLLKEFASSAPAK